MSSDKTIPATNKSAPTVYISEPTWAAQFNQWSQIAAFMILERSCPEEGLPLNWEVRRTANVPLEEVISTIIVHLGWEDVVILTDGRSDGELYHNYVRAYMQLL